MGKAGIASLEIVHDRLVYAVSSGSCQVEAWEGHYAWIEVLVKRMFVKQVSNYSYQK